MTKVTITLRLDTPLTDVEIECIRTQLEDTYSAENVEVYQHGIKAS